MGSTWRASAEGCASGLDSSAKEDRFITRFLLASFHIPPGEALFRYTDPYRSVTASTNSSIEAFLSYNAIRSWGDWSCPIRSMVTRHGVTAWGVAATVHD